MKKPFNKNLIIKPFVSGIIGSFLIVGCGGAPATAPGPAPAPGPAAIAPPVGGAPGSPGFLLGNWRTNPLPMQNGTVVMTLSFTQSPQPVQAIAPSQAHATLSVTGTCTSINGAVTTGTATVPVILTANSIQVLTYAPATNPQCEVFMKEGFLPYTSATVNGQLQTTIFNAGVPIIYIRS